MPNAFPGWEVPSITNFDGRVIVPLIIIVLSNSVVPGRANKMVSITRSPFAVAFSTASRKVPGPVSALEVTVNVSASVVRQLQRATRSRNSGLLRYIWVQGFAPKVVFPAKTYNSLLCYLLSAYFL